MQEGKVVLLHRLQVFKYLRSQHSINDGDMIIIKGDLKLLKELVQEVLHLSIRYLGMRLLKEVDDVFSHHLSSFLILL